MRLKSLAAPHELASYLYGSLATVDVVNSVRLLRQGRYTAAITNLALAGIAGSLSWSHHQSHLIGKSIMEGYERLDMGLGSLTDVVKQMAEDTDAIDIEGADIDGVQYDYRPDPDTPVAPPRERPYVRDMELPDAHERS